MNILIVGSGAREHCLAWHLRRSSFVRYLYCAPGNAGTREEAENVPIAADNLEALADFAQANRIHITVVGPEAPLVAGIADLFAQRGLALFGPKRDAARLEGSKAWTKELLRRAGVPTAEGAVFRDPDAARRYVRERGAPIVVKADGLAAGKGVVVAQTEAEALEAVSSMMERHAFGPAGDFIVIEECLSGTEVSLLAITDGSTVLPLAPACDYKRVFDGDQGPNTGGMGAFCPPGFITPEALADIQERILNPTVAAMAEEGIAYKGVLYAGLMMTEAGPKVLEYNCRFGDPETQVIIPRMRNDLAELMRAVMLGELAPLRLEWDEGPCCGVVMASGGYPGEFKTGLPLEGLYDDAEDTLVFHAGTTVAREQVVTAGGRVLTVVGRGATMADARRVTYDRARAIRFQGCHYRQDIALREL